jgi:DNA invertase Pin-like site-specific DNA recombinase
MNTVIYARYSSHSQTEQSIEGQLETCYEYAKNNGYTVIGEYIDRAQSGTTDKREQFQRMISDSDRHTFEAVLVYQLDRFARNRYDSAINKQRLKKNSVRVISARENISDDASGILVEGVLESMAEYYSVELSQKIRRGMNINAEKHLSNGSNPGFGYTVDEERRFHIDPETAPIVREIFEMYAGGKTATEIVNYLNGREIRTSRGNTFNKNSMSRILRNKRYIGNYIYKGAEIPDAMPRIINDELFNRVQRILDRNKKAPARARAREEYILTTKLFCGYCREMMVGYSGTSRTGTMYHYYICKNARKKQCKKKVVSKQAIEDKVVSECRKLLTDSNIKKIAQAVAIACKSDYDNSEERRIKTRIKETDEAIENLWKAIEHGRDVEMITERIDKRKQEKEKLQGQLAIETGKQVIFTAPQIEAFLYSLKKGKVDDERNRKGIINIFLRAVYLWDDKLTLILNGGDKPITIDDVLLDEIEADSKEFVSSSMVAVAPPTLSLSMLAFGLTRIVIFMFSGETSILSTKVSTRLRSTSGSLLFRSALHLWR